MAASRKLFPNGGFTPTVNLFRDTVGWLSFVEKMTFTALQKNMGEMGSISWGARHWFMLLFHCFYIFLLFVSNTMGHGCLNPPVMNCTCVFVCNWWAQPCPPLFVLLPMLTAQLNWTLSASINPQAVGPHVLVTTTQHVVEKWLFFRGFQSVVILLIEINVDILLRPPYVTEMSKIFQHQI